jgi:hypothetical protein
MAIVLVLANTAFAATAITQPNTNPFHVPGNPAGTPQPFQVVATGFTPGGNVSVEQCDGVDPASPTWSIADCDPGSSPAPVSADVNGVATFDVGSQHQFTPFKGASPQTLFNCLSPNQASPANGLQDYTNCYLRVATNAFAATTDQVFLNMILPDAITETAPVPQNQAVTTGTGQTSTITLTATDDVDGTPPTHYQITQLPAGGTVNVNGNPAALNTSYATNNGTSLDISFTAPAASSVQTLKFQANDAFAGHNFGDGGTGTVTISVGTPPVDQPITAQVNGGQLVLSCNAPGSPNYPLLTCPTLALPAIQLNGASQAVSGGMNPIYVSDNRGDLTADWSLTSYMVKPSVPGCNTADFCNTTNNADLTLPQNHIAATQLALTPAACAPSTGNNNLPATVDAGGSYGGAPIGVCHATHPGSGGTFQASGTFHLVIPASTAAGLYQGTVEYLVA